MIKRIRQTFLLALFACAALSCHPQKKAAEWVVPDSYLPQAIAPEAIVRHHAITLEYSEPDEQARWVAYMLCRSRLDGRFHRNKTPGCFFHPDSTIATGSATPDDYRHSGYSRGHLVPAADMKWDSLAQVETFLFSNISPQREDFNSGVWNRLESKVRQWAKQYDTIIVVTGPLLTGSAEQVIGPNKVTVPTAFFKAIYIPNLHQAIGFLIPHHETKEPLTNFMLSIDELEERIKIDLFSGMADETAIEHTLPRNL